MNYNGLKEDKRLVKAVPSARQIAYENMEFFCFIHFTVNTFTGSEWGDGTEPESILIRQSWTHASGQKQQQRAG